MFDNFPPLYECSTCGKPVKITFVGDGLEPLKEWSCTHTHAVIWANRKVTLRGAGSLSEAQKQLLKIKLTVRQFLSAITGRSV